MYKKYVISMYARIKKYIHINDIISITHILVKNDIE